MKTIELFADESKRNLLTVQSWIKNGWVNGAAFEAGEYIISDLARPPYLRASKKDATAIRKGIVVGCKRRLSVNENVFDLPPVEFSIYVDQLVNAGLIEKRVIEGCTYYYSTPKADAMSDNQIRKIVRDLALFATEAVIRSVT